MVRIHLQLFASNANNPNGLFGNAIGGDITDNIFPGYGLSPTI